MIGVKALAKIKDAEKTEKGYYGKISLKIMFIVTKNVYRENLG